MHELYTGQVAWSGLHYGKCTAAVDAQAHTTRHSSQQTLVPHSTQLLPPVYQMPPGVCTPCTQAPCAACYTSTQQSSLAAP